jgi:methionyl-tRNA formyltransferase
MDINYVFIGGTLRGYKLLEKLILKKHIPKLAFILAEDEHEEMKYSDSITALCNKHKIKNFLRKKLTAADEDLILQNKYDFAFVCGWRTIINMKVNKAFKAGMLAAHDSLLPKYRGFAPLNWAIINGEKQTGVTMFRITAGETDAGPILGQLKIDIKPNEYASDVYAKITDATQILYLDFIGKYVRNKWKEKKQDESKATYTCKRTPADGKIDWSKSSVEVYNLIRALAHPYPGSFCNFNGETFHVRKATLGNSNAKVFSGRISGRVISVTDNGIEVLCGKGTVFIEQWENKSKGIVEKPSNTVKSITATLT